MNQRVHQNPSLIYSEGTQVVALKDVVGAAGRILHPKGSVGVVVHAPSDLDHSYRIQFLDGFEELLRRDEIAMLAHFKEGEIGDFSLTAIRSNLYERVFFGASLVHEHTALMMNSPTPITEGFICRLQNCIGRCTEYRNRSSAMKRRNIIGSCNDFSYWP